MNALLNLIKQEDGDGYSLNCLESLKDPNILNIQIIWQVSTKIFKSTTQIKNVIY